MSETVEKKEFLVHCVDFYHLSLLERVWRALDKLSSRHYAGPTVLEIEKYANGTGSIISVSDIEQALLAFGCQRGKGCVVVSYCQEGTAGPFAARFKQHDCIIPRFGVTLPTTFNYKVEINS